MLIHKLQNKLRRTWLNMKNIFATAIVVTLFTATLIGLLAIVPIILVVIVAITLTIAAKFVYEQYTRNSKTKHIDID